MITIPLCIPIVAAVIGSAGDMVAQSRSEGLQGVHDSGEYGRNVAFSPPNGSPVNQASAPEESDLSVDSFDRRGSTEEPPPISNGTPACFVSANVGFEIGIDGDGAILESWSSRP